ncbi:pentatricopeptide repeat-containing protein-like, mitochondrial [Iris pallida]|uniref:Pentatricopeptide repeat-containing protein-like, mitochondrial n=1 Tax=Iris pallida TaxID=29817 RepID=A0AAX6HB12_IRIPA|nr:pentatricopeptide repeat-containing protein-like, mitochondrial [Iris pallida]
MPSSLPLPLRRRCRRPFSTVVDLAHLSTPLMDPAHLSSLPKSTLLSAYSVTPPIHPWPRTLTQKRLSHLLRTQPDPHLSLRVFLHAAHFHSPAFVPSYPTYLSLVHRLVRSRLLSPLPSLLRLLRDSGTPCGEELFIVLIRAYSSSSKPSLSLRTFLSIPSFGVRASVRSFNALLNAMTQNRRYDLVALLFKNCQTRFRILPNVFTCNILLKAMLKLGDLSGALEVLDDMPEWGMAPNVVTYTTFVAFYCARGDMGSAREMADEIRSRGCVPDVTTYTVLVDGYCRAGRMGDAVKVMDDMEADGVAPNDVTYSVAIEALCRAGRSGEALGFLKEMLRGNHVPSSSLCCKVIDVLCEGGKVEDACEIWRRLLKKNVTPDNSVTSTLIYWLCKAGKVWEAKRLFGEFEKGFIPSVLTYNTLISGMCENGELQEAGKLWDDMVEKKCGPNDFTYNVLIKGFCKTGRPEEGVKVLEEMLDKGFAPNKFTIGVLVDGLSECGKEEEVIELLRNLVSRKGGNLGTESWDVLLRKAIKDTDTWKDTLSMALVT